MKKESKIMKVLRSLTPFLRAIAIWVAICYGLWLSTKDNTVEKYEAEMLVIDKYEDSYETNNVALSNALKMPIGTFKTEHDLYIIVVEYEMAEDGKAEIEVEKERYDQISTGDMVEVEVEELYKKGEFDSYEMTLK